MDPSTVLDVHHICMCARHQRSYILAYLCINRDPPSSSLENQASSSEHHPQSVIPTVPPATPTEHSDSQTQHHTEQLTLGTQLAEGGGHTQESVLVSQRDTRPVDERNVERFEHRDVLFTVSSNNESENTKNWHPKMSCQLVEKFVAKFRKKHKSHRNILDQESGLIGSMLKKEVIELTYISKRMKSVTKDVINLLDY